MTKRCYLCNKNVPHLKKHYKKEHYKEYLDRFDRPKVSKKEKELKIKGTVNNCDKKMKKKFDASIPRRMYWLDEINDKKLCPKCNSKLKNEYCAYLFAVKTKFDIETFVTGNRGGYFCPKCPIVVLDGEEFSNILQGLNITTPSCRISVVGIVNMEAIPPKKSHLPIGSDDNPILLVEFIQDSVGVVFKSHKRKKAKRVINLKGNAKTVEKIFCKNMKNRYSDEEILVAYQIWEDFIHKRANIHLKNLNGWAAGIDQVLNRLAFKFRSQKSISELYQVSTSILLSRFKKIQNCLGITFLDKRYPIEKLLSKIIKKSSMDIIANIRSSKILISDPRFSYIRSAEMAEKTLLLICIGNSMRLLAQYKINKAIPKTK